MRLINKNLLYLLLFIIGFNGCQDRCFYYEEQTIYEEILQPLSEIRNSFAVKEDFEITKPGNIYTYDKYLLVAEKFKGIHILDNTNPSNPIKLKFIALAGNENFAVYNNTLMADNGPDLLSIDISDINNITLKHNEQNVNSFNVKGDKFLVGYNVVKKKVKVECDNRNFEGARNVATPASAAPESSSHAGKGGSMSKFAVIDNFLYIINSSELLPINISNPNLPAKKNKVNFFSSNVETVFPYKKIPLHGYNRGRADI